LKAGLLAGLKDAALAAAVGLAGSLALFGPNLPYFSRYAIGATGTDAQKHIWCQWWTWTRFVEDGRIPLEAELINFPEGGAFFCVDSGNALLGGPLRPFLDAALVYDLLFLVNATLAAMAAAMLAREVNGPGPASLFAGAGFAFCAWVMAFAVNSGVSETDFLFPMPLAILFGVRMLTRRGWGAPFLCAGFLLLQAFACWSYGIIASVILALVGLLWLLARPWRAPEGAGWRMDWRALLRLALSLAVVAAAAAPLFLSVSGSVTDADAVYDRHLTVFPSPDRPPSFYPIFNNFPLDHFFTPGVEGLIIQSRGVEQLLYAAWPGALVWALALLGLVVGGARARMAAAAAALCMTLALGPYVQLNTADPGHYNAVYHLFYNYFPLFNATIHSTDRFAVGFQLGLVVTAAAGLGWLLSKLPSKARLPAALLACALAIADAATLSPAPWPVAQTPATAHPASEAMRERDIGAVIDLPFYEADSEQFIGDIFLQQTIHHQPVPFRLDGIGVQVVSQPLRGNAFYRRLEAILMGTRSMGGAGCDGASGLANLGFGAILYRPEEAREEAREDARALLEACLGPGELIGDRVLYDLRR